MRLYKHQLRNLERSNKTMSDKLTDLEDKNKEMLKLAEINEMDKAKLAKEYCNTIKFQTTN
jgi:hypothetical protein